MSTQQGFPINHNERRSRKGVTVSNNGLDRIGSLDGCDTEEERVSSNSGIDSLLDRLRDNPDHNLVYNEGVQILAALSEEDCDYYTDVIEDIFGTRIKLNTLAGRIRQQRNNAVSNSRANSKPADNDALLLKYDPDDNGNAEAMKLLYGEKYLFTPAYGWLQWTGTHWLMVPEQIVTQDAIATLKRRRHAAVDAGNEAILRAAKVQNSNVSACLNLFKSYVIVSDVTVFDADRDLLNCQNGVLNLRTGELVPHDPSQRFTYCLSVEYDPDADITAWQSFLLNALGDDQDAFDYFQMCAGYSLTGHTREEKMFYLYGPTRAGKGTTTETLLKLLPKPLGIEVDFATFTAKRDNDSQNFDLAELKSSRLVVASESNKHQSLNPAKINQITGGNDVRCAFKHKDMFTYRPQYKVWLVSNHTVKADPDDNATWGRVQVFTFPRSHLGSEDMRLKDKMKSSENLPGVLRWCVEGAIRWYAAGRLVEPEAVRNATNEHRDEQDYIKQWIGDCCTLGGDNFTSFAQINESYQDWCRAQNIKPQDTADFSETLVKRFGCVKKKRNHGKIRGYEGIMLGTVMGDTYEVSPPQARMGSGFEPTILPGMTGGDRVTEGDRVTG